MIISPFRVRLATETGFKENFIGTVIGEDNIKLENGIQKCYSVLWFNVNEETGEETISTQPAPAAHLSHELRAHVDPDYWFSDEDEEETDLDLSPSQDEHPIANA